MDSLLKYEEKLVFQLRKLYHEFGYKPFKMSKFEAYDLYANHKDFLVSEGVITFTDTDGSLLALKPDVTLSVVKNFRSASGLVQKSYYNENVYRTDRSGHGFREIVQTGLECIGDVDAVAVCEVLQLASRTLETISDRYFLDISHMGILEEILSALDLNSAEKKMIIDCVAEKNADELCSLPFQIPEAEKMQLLCLVNCYGPLKQTLEKTKVLHNLKAFDELLQYATLLDQIGIVDCINLDFSIIGSKNYYNGLIFRGYIDGVPESVVSGGQYDRLMKKMGKNAKGIGFAVYLNRLEHFYVKPSGCDYNTVLVYEDTHAKDVLIAAANLRQENCSLLVTKNMPKDITWENCYIIRAGKVERYERNS